MQIHIFRSVDEADKATGLTVVIDVFRAFSVEAYLFKNGASQIIPVQTIEEAFALRSAHPEYVLVGERGGRPIEGFDHGNSPTEIQHTDFSGKTVVHTTSNGTKGLLNAVHADSILAGSFLTADSIVAYIHRTQSGVVSLVATSPDPQNDNEDIMLAYYIRDRLEGKQIYENEIKQLLTKTRAFSLLFTEIGVPPTDFDLCVDFNSCNFVIKKHIDPAGSIVLLKEQM